MASEIAEKMAAAHNAKVAAEKSAATDTPGIGDNALKSFVGRRKALEEEKQTVSEDIRELNAEMKTADPDPKAVAAIVRRQMEDADKRAKRVAHEEKVDGYLSALGMLD